MNDLVNKVMQPKAKSNSVITHKQGANGEIIFTVLNAGDITLDVAATHQTIREQAMYHGFVQRISDQAAMSRDTETGLPATALDKFQAMQKLVEHYMTGTAEWRMTGGGGGSRAGSMLIEALCEAYPKKTREELRAWLKKQSAASRAALAVEPRLKAIIDRMTAELAESVDTDGLLSELE